MSFQRKLHQFAKSIKHARLLTPTRESTSSKTSNPTTPYSPFWASPTRLSCARSAPAGRLRSNQPAIFGVTADPYPDGFFAIFNSDRSVRKFRSNRPEVGCRLVHSQFPGRALFLGLEGFGNQRVQLPLIRIHFNPLISSLPV